MVRSSIRVHGGLAINSVGPGFRVSTGPEVLTLLHTGPSRIRLLSVFSVVLVIVTIFLNKDSAPNTEITRTNRYLPPKRKGYICVFQLARLDTVHASFVFSSIYLFIFPPPPPPLAALSFCSPALFVYSPTFARPRGEMEVSEIECVTACINIISRTIRHKFCHDRDII